jgi:hypothetical protein
MAEDVLSVFELTNPSSRMMALGHILFPYISGEEGQEAVGSRDVGVPMMSRKAH